MPQSMLSWSMPGPQVEASLDALPLRDQAAREPYLAHNGELSLVVKESESGVRVHFVQLQKLSTMIRLSVQIDKVGKAVYPTPAKTLYQHQRSAKREILHPVIGVSFETAKG